LHSSFFWFCGESYRSVAQRDEKKLNAAEKKRRVLDEREAGFLIFFQRGVGSTVTDTSSFLISVGLTKPTPLFF
jgi:hypothetical protein